MKISHIVVPEGLAYEVKFKNLQCSLSDYYQAVLDEVIKNASKDDIVYLAPGNYFGCDYAEEEYALTYLLERRPDFNILFPSVGQERSYLDTFDNARFLRIWLESKLLWPLETIYLYCNSPHQWRSWLLFRLCGFKIDQIITSRPQKVVKKIVPRLWFYNFFIFQIFYELLSIVYGLIRYIYYKLLNV